MRTPRPGAGTGMNSQHNGRSETRRDLAAELIAPEILDVDEIGIKAAKVAQQLIHGEDVEADLVGLDGAVSKLIEKLTAPGTDLHLVPSLDKSCCQVERIGCRVGVIDSLVDEEDSHP